MKNIFQKSLIVLVVLSNFTVAAGCSFAKKTTPSEDPDLKLSIEELKKKYPIDWFDTKYGNVDLCPTLDDPEPLNPPQNLVCNFQPNQYPFHKFSDFEIRSIFVNIKKDDFRIRQISRMIVLEYFEHKPESSLTPEEKMLSNFIYSEKIITPFKKGDCITIRNIRYNCTL